MPGKIRSGAEEAPVKTFFSERDSLDARSAELPRKSSGRSLSANPDDAALRKRSQDLSAMAG
jgi:hypothetical protein